ncbi:tetracycline resistance protein [Bacillus thuringiensis]|uniref:Tetracycline resistance protein n=1 Tax=Bacillus cereus TaxID=1396 RepID=A0ABD4LID9_BACCE|nr:transporter, putative [Bacillus cereus F837/76]AJG60426.1 putative tetracycline resistance determinant tetV [Bacillus cereus D17]EEK57014.1 Tetracycline resistance determinant tetV [Bacillus cereus BGSC 6E1]MBG9579025.1 tetracycline resistance protein [Bacillus thuringiensis]MBK1610066.1 tetracycline resistance protein [Bacillus cereus]HDR7336948.1 tetracycline resistance protein [Bacillus anthracis]
MKIIKIKTFYQEDLFFRNEERSIQGEVPKEKNVSYVGKLLLPVKASPHFKFLWVGQLLSTLGSSITIITLAILVLVTIGVALCVPSIRRFN